MRRRSSFLILIYSCLITKGRLKVLLLLVLKEIIDILLFSKAWGTQGYPLVVGGQARRCWEAGELLDPWSPTPAGQYTGLSLDSRILN